MVSSSIAVYPGIKVSNALNAVCTLENSHLNLKRFWKRKYESFNLSMSLNFMLVLGTCTWSGFVVYIEYKVCVCVCVVLPAMKHRDHSWVACCMTLVDSTACEKSCNNSVERRMRSWNCKWLFFCWISLYSTPCKLLLGGRPWFSDSETCIYIYIYYIALYSMLQKCSVFSLPWKSSTILTNTVLPFGIW